MLFWSYDSALFARAFISPPRLDQDCLHGSEINLIYTTDTNIDKLY